MRDTALWLWISFNVFLPLSTIFFVWLGLWLIGKRKPFIAIIRDGQLCFFSIVTISLFIYDAIMHEKPAWIFGIISSVVLLFSMFVYGVAVINNEINGQENAGKIGWTSIFLAVTAASLVISARELYGML